MINYTFAMVNKRVLTDPFWPIYQFGYIEWIVDDQSRSLKFNVCTFDLDSDLPTIDGGKDAGSKMVYPQRYSINRKLSIDHVDATMNDGEYYQIMQVPIIDISDARLPKPRRLLFRDNRMYSLISVVEGSRGNYLFDIVQDYDYDRETDKFERLKDEIYPGFLRNIKIDELIAGSLVVESYYWILEHHGWGHRPDHLMLRYRSPNDYVPYERVLRDSIKDHFFILQSTVPTKLSRGNPIFSTIIHPPIGCVPMKYPAISQFSNEFEM